MNLLMNDSDKILTMTGFDIVPQRLSEIFGKGEEEFGLIYFGKHITYDKNTRRLFIEEEAHLEESKVKILTKLYEAANFEIHVETCNCVFSFW